MNWQEVLKKYGVWIAAGALVLYLVLKNKGAIPRPTIPGALGGADFAAQTERLRQAGALDLARLQADNNLEAARLKAANDRFNLEQQALARQRALDAAQRGQTLGLLGSLAKSIADAFRSQSQPKGSNPGGGTPPTFPDRARTQLPQPPYYPIPAPNIPDVYNPPFTPSYPQINDYPLSVTDWGEAPQFSSAGMDLDTGASFYDMWAGGDFNYGYGSGSSDDYSSFPELNYNTYSDPYDVGAGGDFYYGYGADGGYDTGGDAVDYGGYGYGGDE